MSDNLIADIVRDFITSNIDSITELEALLLIRREPQLKWTAADLAERLYTSPEQVEEAIENLTLRGLSCIKRGKPVTYYYQPSTPELDRLVGEVADTYSKYLIEVTNLIHSKPQMKVQQFADAFRLRNRRDK